MSFKELPVRNLVQRKSFAIGASRCDTKTCPVAKHYTPVTRQVILGSLRNGLTTGTKHCTVNLFANAIDLTMPPRKTFHLPISSFCWGSLQALRFFCLVPTNNFVDMNSWTRSIFTSIAHSPHILTDPMCFVDCIQVRGFNIFLCELV